MPKSKHKERKRECTYSAECRRFRKFLSFSGRPLCSVDVPRMSPRRNVNIIPYRRVWRKGEVEKNRLAKLQNRASEGPSH